MGQGQKQQNTGMSQVSLWSGFDQGEMIEKCSGSRYMLTTEQRKYDDRYDIYYANIFPEL